MPVRSTVLATTLCATGLLAAGGGGAWAADTSSASSAARPRIVVDAGSRLATIGAHQIGTNMGIWFDVTSAGLAREIASVSPRVLRWPGGSLSDAYHWKNHTSCDQKGEGTYAAVAAYDPLSTFDNFMKRVVIPGHYEAAITLNYGSNAACDGGGDPDEAAAWVAYARRKGYSPYIRYWTVGNEAFGGWELDLHKPAHDAATYAAAMAGPKGYYRRIKAADPAAQVGAIVGPPEWDTQVLKDAEYDFVELHWYPQQPGHEDDRWLLEQGPAAFVTTIDTLRRELQGVHRADVPIMLGEVNSVAYDPGKQSVSIVGGLFTGMLIGEVLKHNVAVMTWWFGAGGTQLCGRNTSDKLYGFQPFGGYDLVAANSMYGWNYCTNSDGATIMPEGAMFPSGNAFWMAQGFAVPGSSVLETHVEGSPPSIRAYAATHGRGYSLMLFNLSQTDTQPVTIALRNASASSFTATAVTYGRQQYDESRRNVWKTPVSASLGRLDGRGASVTLAPWSMTVLTLE